MHVRNENMRNAATPNFIFDHLDLCAFATIDQVAVAVVRHQLAGGMPVEGRHR